MFFSYGPWWNDHCLPSDHNSYYYPQLHPSCSALQAIETLNLIFLYHVLSTLLVYNVFFLISCLHPPHPHLNSLLLTILWTDYSAPMAECSFLLQHLSYFIVIFLYLFAFLTRLYTPWAQVPSSLFVLVSQTLSQVLDKYLLNESKDSFINSLKGALKRSRNEISSHYHSVSNSYFFPFQS